MGKGFGHSVRMYGVFGRIGKGPQKTAAKIVSAERI